MASRPRAKAATWWTSRFTEEQIVRTQGGGGARKVQDVRHKHGVRKHTFYGWKAQYGGCRSSDAARQDSRRNRGWDVPFAYGSRWNSSDGTQRNSSFCVS